MTAQLNILSLFAGIGGLELGLERAGMTTVGQVELDPYCRRVLAKHWPEVPQHDDVRTAGPWWNSVPRPQVDVVCGGFPCQPFSIAGLERGIADERWGWPWFADVIRAVRPSYVVVENVSALLRHSDAFGWLLGDLADLGFDADWDVLTACSVGAPHRRRRLYLVAYPAGTGLQGLHDAGGRVDLQSAAPTVWRDWPSEPSMARVADGIPRRLVRDDIHALGNAVVPQVAELRRQPDRQPRIGGGGVTSLPSGVEDDPTRAFGALLPERLRWRVQPTQKLIADIAAAVRKGWTVEQLVAESTRDIPQSDLNPGSLVTYRVGKCAAAPPPQPAGPARFAQPKPPCGACDGSPGRWMETLDGDRVIHCPNCWVKPTGGQ